ncbi:hypothetical protein V6N13_043258 [Hibiscus sabdariffa]
MATICSSRNIELRLQAWGLGEIKVQRLRGKTFLISIDDEDLFLMLEDLQWSYLKEIFVDIKTWSESLVQKENELSSNLLTKRAIDDIRCMGFGHKSNEVSGVGKSVWAKKLDNKINAHIIGNERNDPTKLSICETDSEGEIDRIFFPELDSEKKKNTVATMSRTTSE